MGATCIKAELPARRPCVELPPGFDLGFFDERVRTFKAMANPDGLVTKQSYVAYLSSGKSLSGSAAATATFGQFFETADRDRSGMLDIHEWLHWQNIQPLDNVALRLRAVFLLFDRDDSGTLSWDEVRRLFVLACRGQPGMMDATAIKQVVDDVFDKVDTDKDGSLSMEEFVSGFAKHPLVLDFFVRVLWKSPRATPQ
jgi:Ca2+-binding EF-hand superfamily protein